MKVVFVLNGFYDGCIQALDFMTDEMDFVTLEMGHLDEIRTSGDKMIITYGHALIDGKDAAGSGRLLSMMKLQAIHVEERPTEHTALWKEKMIVGNDICITDIHIYDRTEKSEIYMIPKSDIHSAIIDTTEEA